MIAEISGVSAKTLDEGAAIIDFVRRESCSRADRTSGYTLSITPLTPFFLPELSTCCSYRNSPRSTESLHSELQRGMRRTWDWHRDWS